MVPRPPDADICKRAAGLHRVWFGRVDRSYFVRGGVVFCVEALVALTCHSSRCCTRRDALERVGESSCSSAAALFRWSVCGLVWLQFRQRSHHRSHPSLRPTPAFYSARSQSAPLATAIRLERGIADRPGRVQPYRVGRTFSNRCARGHLFWNYLAHVLFICHEANAGTRGFTPDRAPVCQTHTSP